MPVGSRLLCRSHTRHLCMQPRRIRTDRVRLPGGSTADLMAYWVNAFSVGERQSPCAVIHESACRRMGHPNNRWRRFDDFEQAREFAESLPIHVELCECVRETTAVAEQEGEQG